MSDAYRNNDFTKQQIRGIDLTIKSASKRFPFIKGWKFEPDYENYTSQLYINLIVDFDEVAKFYNTPLNPLYAKRTTPLNSSLILTFMNPYTISDYNSQKYHDYFQMSYNKTKEITNLIESIYNNLPDEFAITYTYGKMLGSDEPYTHRSTLNVQNFMDITSV